jgi:transposase InsO family protein
MIVMAICTRSASSHLAHFMLSPTPSTSGINNLAIPGKIVFFKPFDLLISIVIRQPPPPHTHTCHACQLGKHTRLPFFDSSSFSFHADVWTSHVLSNSGYQYYLVLLDDFTHYVWTFPLCQKSEVLPSLLAFRSYVATQHCLPILAIQTDNGKEFDNFAIRTFFTNHGIHLRLSSPYTSPQNGKTERILRTMNDCISTMLM